MAIETQETLLFHKVGLADDDDWSSTSVDEPGAGRVHTLSWALEGPEKIAQAPKLLLGLTFRNSNDEEVAGTATITVLLKSKASLSAGDSTSRASWKKIGSVTSHPHNEFAVLDVGGEGEFAVRLSSISAVGAAGVYVTARQWGGT